MSEQELRSKLEEICNSIKGLSLEVEGLRLNNNSNSDFMLVALRDLLAAIRKLQEAFR